MAGETRADERPRICVSATVKDLVDPDIAEIGVDFHWHCPTQEECAEHYAAECEQVRAALEPLGLANELLLAHYCSCPWHSRRKDAITSFEYWARGTLRLRMAEHDVAAVWSALNTCQVKATMGVAFSLEDEDAAEERLLGRAMAKARHEAGALAAATGMRLADVKQISYNRLQGGYEFPATGGLYLEEASLDSANFDPKPIGISCTVDVDWWLEEREGDWEA